MELIIWIGAALSLCGVALLLWCMIDAARAKRAKLPDDLMRRRLQRIVMINLVAMGVSGLGLMMVIAGIFLS